jgi:hypothetical protein
MHLTSDLFFFIIIIIARDIESSMNKDFLARKKCEAKFLITSWTRAFHENRHQSTTNAMNEEKRRGGKAASKASKEGVQGCFMTHTTEKKRRRRRRRKGQVMPHKEVRESFAYI